MYTAPAKRICKLLSQCSRCGSYGERSRNFVTFGRWISCAEQYLLRKKDFGMFSVLRYRSAGFAPAAGSYDFRLDNSPQRLVKFIPSNCFAQSSNSNKAFYQLCAYFLISLLELLSDALFYRTLDNMLSQWSKVKQASAKSGLITLFAQFFLFLRKLSRCFMLELYQNL